MDRRSSINALLAGFASLTVLNKNALAGVADITGSNARDAYLMAHFKENDQKLYYAYSHDARNWTALNQRKPVFDSGVNLRDPFIGYAKGKYHLVHTKGWDYPVIHHYESTDLINWAGGEIRVITDDKKRAWAPEWFYDDKSGLFYIFWASEHTGHNSIYYTTTKNWDDIKPENARVYYDIGMDVIDFSVIKANGLYYAFHKCGSIKYNMPVSFMSSPTLDPGVPGFSFGKHGAGKLLDTDGILPIEGPEVIKLNGQNKWYVYADPFHNDFIAWETIDFKKFNRIPVSVPRGAKHCSMLKISRRELDLLLKKYPPEINN